MSDLILTAATRRFADKDLLDTTSSTDIAAAITAPAALAETRLTTAFQAAVAGGADFSSALAAMIDAAERGWHSTKDLQARIGRAARLGERSIGVLDAGATSCFLILKTLGTSVRQRLG